MLQALVQALEKKVAEKNTFVLTFLHWPEMADMIDQQYIDVFRDVLTQIQDSLQKK